MFISCLKGKLDSPYQGDLISCGQGDQETEYELTQSLHRSFGISFLYHPRMAYLPTLIVFMRNVGE